MPLGMETVDIITIVVGLAAFFSVIAVWMTAIAPSQSNSRVKALQARRDELRAGLVETKRRKRADKGESVDFMRVVVNKLKLLQSEQAKKVTVKLARAGWRSKDAVIIYLFGRLVGPLLGAGVGFILVYGMNLIGEDTLYRAAGMLGAVILGLYTPDLIIKNATTKRSDALRKSLPDALDLMVICAEAGLTLDATMSRVAKEMGHANPELGDEFSLTSIELGFLPERRIALNNLTDRVDLPSMRSVVTTLIQSEKYGTPLAKSLRVLSAEFRNERMMRAEEKAARLPAVMTVPLILFILPTLFVVLLGPAACDVADNLVGKF